MARGKEVTTPEGAVKREIKKILDHFDVYYEMPVPGGYGRSGLDFHGCFAGRYFAIEAKAPGKKPTRRQEGTIKAIRRRRGMVFVIDGNVAELEQWLLEQWRLANDPYK